VIVSDFGVMLGKTSERLVVRGPERSSPHHPARRGHGVADVVPDEEGLKAIFAVWITASRMCRRRCPRRLKG
jgi:hypothetical protein